MACQAFVGFSNSKLHAVVLLTVVVAVAGVVQPRQESSVNPNGGVSMEVSPGAQAGARSTSSISRKQDLLRRAATNKEESVAPDGTLDEIGKSGDMAEETVSSPADGTTEEATAPVGSTKASPADGITERAPAPRGSTKATATSPAKEGAAASAPEAVAAPQKVTPQSAPAKGIAAKAPEANAVPQEVTPPSLPTEGVAAKAPEADAVPQEAAPETPANQGAAPSAPQATVAAPQAAPNEGAAASAPQSNVAPSQVASETPANEGAAVSAPQKTVAPPQAAAQSPAKEGAVASAPEAVAAPQEATSKRPTKEGTTANAPESVEAPHEATTNPAAKEAGATPPTKESTGSRTVKTFQSYDVDGNGALEKKEAERLMKDMGVPVAGWRNYTAERKGQLTEQDFSRLQQDAKLFSSADANGSGFLEKDEIEAVLTKAHLPDDAFNWRSFDYDGDGKLSETEFLAAGPAAASAASVQPAHDPEEAAATSAEDMYANPSKEADASLMEETGDEQDGGEDDSGSDDDSMNQMTLKDDKAVWKEADTDGDGTLSADEMIALMKKAGLGDFDWRSYDRNKDGKISEAEFVRMGRAAKPMVDSKFRRHVEALTGEPAELGSAQSLFQSGDKDKNGYLEGDEIQQFLTESDVDQKKFRWQTVDTDGDGKISRAEFMRSMGEQDVDEDQDTQIRKSSAPSLFETADVDQSGYLEDGEIKTFLEDAHVDPKFRWQSVDLDGDGKLSRAEFVKAVGGKEDNDATEDS